MACHVEENKDPIWPGYVLEVPKEHGWLVEWAGTCYHDELDMELQHKNIKTDGY